MTKIARDIARNEPKLDELVAERSVGKLTKLARATASGPSDAERESSKFARRIEAAADEGQDELARKTADTAEMGQMFVDLLAEQTRHGMATANAFSRAVNWSDLAEAQSNFIAGSFARISQINDHYRKFFLSGMSYMATPARR